MAEAGFNSFGARDLGGTVASSVVSALPVFLVAALAVQIEDSLHFGPADLGMVVSLYYLSAALASIPLSRAAEAIGSLRAMRVGCIITGLLLIVLAGFARSVTGLSVVMVATGMISAGIQPATNLFLVRRIPLRYRGFAFGIKQAAVPVATLLGGLAVPVFGVTVGWRWAFIAGAVLAIGASVLLPRSRVSFTAHRSRPAIAALGSGARRHLMLLTCGFGLAAPFPPSLSPPR